MPVDEIASSQIRESINNKIKAKWERSKIWTKKKEKKTGIVNLKLKVFLFFDDYLKGTGNSK